jgi:hypothetical protein
MINIKEKLPTRQIIIQILLKLYPKPQQLKGPFLVKHKKKKY